MEDDYLNQYEDASLVLEGVEICFKVRKFVVDEIIAYFVKIRETENFDALTNLDELLCLWLPKEVRPSTFAQIEFARDIAITLKIEIQNSVLINRIECMNFINENLDNYFTKFKKNTNFIMN